MTKRRIHPAWTVAVVTFFTRVATFGFRTALLRDKFLP